MHITERWRSPAKVGMIDEAGEGESLHQEGNGEGNEQQCIALDEHMQPHLGDGLG